jgi:hypothetical protein
VYFSEEEHSGAEAYNMFEHPSNRPRVNGYISYSERIFESISQIARLSDSMLVKTGTINRQVTKKVAMPRESWNYMLRTLETSSQEYLEFALNHHFPSKVKITTDNLTLSVNKINCTRYAITARNVAGFDALSAVIGRVGFGIKKKHPNLSAIEANDGSNRLTVQQHDLVHVVHIDETEVLYRDPSFFENVTHVCNPTRPASNFIRMTYETHTNQLALTMKCYSSLVSLLSDDAKSFLRSNNIMTGSVHVLHNNRVWRLIRVREGQSLLGDADDDNNTIWVDNSVVEENEIR